MGIISLHVADKFIVYSGFVNDGERGVILDTEKCSFEYY